MREIKFRAWDKKRNLMLNTMDWTDCNLMQYKSGYKPILIFGGNVHSDFLEECLDVELMQYTGLKDKNGKEIYEGDILKAKYNSSFVMYEVKFENIIDDYGNESVGYYKDDDCEVVGNIYENEELLKDE